MTEQANRGSLLRKTKTNQCRIPACRRQDAATYTCGDAKIAGMQSVEKKGQKPKKKWLFWIRDVPDRLWFYNFFLGFRSNLLLEQSFSYWQESNTMKKKCKKLKKCEKWKRNEQQKMLLRSVVWRSSWSPLAGYHGGYHVPSCTMATFPGFPGILSDLFSFLSSSLPPTGHNFLFICALMTQELPLKTEGCMK